MKLIEYWGEVLSEYVPDLPKEITDRRSIKRKPPITRWLVV